ncbi:MAG: Abi family protein [Catonella sp.]|uniref:Abi family protein n=1 Tax=Catonella sp. TaxID=2382125 RepID=UPI003F9F8977
MKQLLTANDLINHMKEKGITFNIISEADAKKFLLENNYYMKLASYRANYPKYKDGKKIGQYINLDFAYLKELSTIDMHLRYLIMKMCLDIEHALKVSLISHIENNPKEDGYELIRRFIGYTNLKGQQQNEYILKKIRSHQSSEYSKSLIEKYYPYFPVWVFVELISFGDLAYLIAFYDELYSDNIVNNKFMNIVRDLRNASAHSHCLINKLFEPLDISKQIDSNISIYIKNSVPNISKAARTKNLNYRVIYNFIVLLYTYNSVIPDGQIKSKRIKEIKDLFDNRLILHKDYFVSHNQIQAVYNFVKKIVDTLPL